MDDDKVDWYGLVYFPAFLVSCFTMGYGIAGFFPLDGGPVWGINSEIYLCLSGSAAFLLVIWGMTADNEDRMKAYWFLTAFMLTMIILFSYRLVIAPAVFDAFGSGTERTVLFSVIVLIIIVISLYLYGWYRLLLPKIRHTVYHNGGIIDTEHTTVEVRRTFNYNPLFRFIVSVNGKDYTLDYMETAVVESDSSCFRVRLRYGLAKRDIVISNTDRVVINVDYDYVLGILVPSVEGTEGPMDSRGHLDHDDVSRYI